MRALKRAMGAFMLFCAFAFVSAMPVSAEETTVYADNTNYGDYSLYICSQRIIYNGEIPNGVELPAGVTIDYENRVITLDHATITGTTYSYGNETGIRYSAKDEKPLTIRLAGENTINNVNWGIQATTLVNGAADPAVNLVIEGDGILNIQSSAGVENPSTVNTGINGNLRMLSGTLNIWTTEGYNFKGISGGDMEFLGGSVNIQCPDGVQGNSSTLYGVEATGNVSFQDTTVNVEIGRATFAYGMLFITYNGTEINKVTVNNAAINVHVAEAKTYNGGTLQGQSTIRFFTPGRQVGVDDVLEALSNSYYYMGNEAPDQALAKADAFTIMQGAAGVNYRYLAISPTPFDIEQPFPFTDVSGADWFYDEVEYAYTNGIMTGKDADTFAPYEFLARAQFAVILHRMNDEPEVTYADTFRDVGKDIWYTDAILWAADTKVVTGYSNGNFGPGDNINREQMALMMYRYANYNGYDTSMRADFGQYQDAASVSDFAAEAMQWAVGEKIITGKYNETQLDPKGNASRAECATIMMRFMEKYGM